MRIIFMGTPDFAVPTLKALAASDRHEVTLVVTQPDRPKGRSAQPVPSDTKRCAQELGIPLFQPDRIKAPEAVERLKREEADLIVVAAFGQILSQEILDLPRYGCVNVHGSLLPAYRGAAPVQWAVIDGCKEAGNTIMQMDAGLDTGDILAQERLMLDPDETGGSLYEKLARRGGPLLVRTLDEIEAGTAVPVPQDNAKATYAKMLRKEMGDLDWSQSAGALEHRVRGLNPWPGAYTYWNGKRLCIWMAKALPQEQPSKTPEETAAEPTDGAHAQLPGTVTAASGGCLAVQTGDGQLYLTEVQLEGRKRLPVQEFLRGCRIRKGDRLKQRSSANKAGGRE